MTTERLQEIFDITLNHLREQGCASFVTTMRGTEEFTSCMYRGPEGRKCAAGIHISDTKYTAGMEGKSFFTVNNEMLKSEFEIEDMRLISALQEAHDDSLAGGDIKTWERAMKGIAKHKKLTYTPEHTRDEA